MKRIKFFMLLCAFVLALSSGAWADDNVAKFGTTTYTTLQAALNAASNDTSATDVTVTLTAGVSLDKTIELSMDKNLTIDLGSFDISADNIRALHIQSGKVTIKGNGVIHAKGTSDSSSVIRVGNSGKKTATLIVEKGVTISSDNCYGITIFGTNKADNDDNYGQYLFFNGTIQVTGGAGALSGNGTGTNTSTDIVISPDAKIIASADSGIYHPQAGNLVIYGGEIEGKNGIEAKGGDIKIYGGTFKSKGDPSHTRNSDGNSTSGYAISAVNNKDYKGKGIFYIYGGKFDGPVILISDDTTANKSNVSPDIQVWGGSFLSNDKVSTDEAILKKQANVKLVKSGDYYNVLRPITIAAAPTVESKAYEANLTLASFDTFTGGVVSDSVKIDNKSLDISAYGTWAWKEPMTALTAGASTTYKAVFTPTSADRYQSADVDVTVTVTAGTLSLTVSSESPSIETVAGTAKSIDITATAEPTANVTWSTVGDKPDWVTVTSADGKATITASPDAAVESNDYSVKLRATATLANYTTTSKDVTVAIKVTAKEEEKTPEPATPETVKPEILSFALKSGAALKEGKVGEAYSDTLSDKFTVTTSPDNAAYNWSVTGLPSVFTFNASTTAITGTPTDPVDAKITVTVTLSEDKTVAKSADITLTVVRGSSTSDDGDNTGEETKTDEEKIAEDVAKAVDDNGEVSADVMSNILETAGVASDDNGNVSLEAIVDNSTALNAVASVLANSLTAKEGTSSANTLELKSLSLNSLSGLSSLLTAIANDSSTSITITAITIDLGGMTGLTEIKADDLKDVNVDGLDLSTNTSVTTVALKGLTAGTVNMKGNTSVKSADLSGATVDKVDMSGTSVTELKLDSESNVKEIDANGSKVETLELKGNENITSLDVGGTNITSLDAAGCKGLVTLAVEGASSGSEEVGELKELDVTSCDKLENLTVSRNKLFGVKNPGLTGVKSFKARGQRPSSSQSYTRGMSFWEFLWKLWQASIHTDAADQQGYDEDSVTDTPFYDANMTVTDASGEIDINEDGSLSRMPSGDLTYESDPFGTVTAAGISGVMTAADTDEGLEVTISSGSSSTEETLRSSGGGCNAGLGLFALSALIVFATLKQRR